MAKINKISIPGELISQQTLNADGVLVMPINGKKVSVQYRHVPSAWARFVAFISGSSVKLADREWVKVLVQNGTTQKTVLINQNAFHKALSENAGGYWEQRPCWLEESAEPKVKLKLKPEVRPQPVLEERVVVTAPEAPLSEQAGFGEVAQFYIDAIKELKPFAKLVNDQTPVDEKILRPIFARIEKKYNKLQRTFPSMVKANGRAKEFMKVFTTCKDVLA